MSEHAKELDRAQNILAMCDDVTAGNWPADAAIVEIRKVAAAQGEALTQAQATIQRERCETAAAFKDKDAELRRAYAGWQQAEAEAAALRNTNIVLHAEAEVGQQVRALVQAISRDGETVVGAVQRLIAEQADEKANGAYLQRLLDAECRDSVVLKAEQAGLRAQVQAFQWQPIETAPEATYVLVRVPNYGINIATMTRDPNILGPNGAYWFIRGDNDPCKPTHWMPIPAFDALLSSVSLPQPQEKKDDLSRVDGE